MEKITSILQCNKNGTFKPKDNVFLRRKIAKINELKFNE